MAEYLMITGSFPPQVCGVGDYVGRFMEAADNSKWKLFHSLDWKLKTLAAKIRQISSSECPTIIMQYPTQGYGWSLVPHILCLYFSWFSRKKFIVVMHEFSQLSFKARLAGIMLMSANKIIFTNEFEKGYVHRRLCVPLKKCGVVKIISNISVAPKIKDWQDRHIDIAYFGHIRPNKGLEDFFRVADDILKKCKVKVCLIGQLLPEFATYFESLCRKYPDINIEIRHNLSDYEVADSLNDTKVAFLPFPDGLSERRGSFLAAISNGAVVVSYKGEFTTARLEEIAVLTLPCKASQCILDIIDTAFEDQYEQFRSECENYSRNDIPGSWQTVVEMYESIIN
ncbi:glycosyltransferase family 1 protein [Alistipes finegoldii]|jgi:glycosyltransferase involved in cell wall biosynthesis|uniref:glycosyltransferase family 1 protein n=1 Tax=Alistipes finegoldii TaxID=214856 RepID=UPI00248B18C3|nr:glycosyltransferase family 1 protein [Alistipes finegoldii]